MSSMPILEILNATQSLPAPPALSSTSPASSRFSPPAARFHSTISDWSCLGLSAFRPSPAARTAGAPAHSVTDASSHAANDVSHLRRFFCFPPRIRLSISNNFLSSGANPERASPFLICRFLIMHLLFSPLPGPLAQSRDKQQRQQRAG